MDRDRILGILRDHEAELKAEGLLHLRLFGSYARGEATSLSDVDILFECDDSDFRNVLRAYGFQDDLSEMLGVRTHLSSAKYMRPEIQVKVATEIIDVF